MKRFFVSILIVLGFLLVISLPVDYAFSNYLAQSKSRKYVGWNDIISGSVNADLLVIGSSRAWVQYDTRIMDSVLHVNSYNLGIDGSALNRQMLKYRVYDHFQEKKAKVVLINMDYASAIGNRIGYEREQFFPYLWNRFNRQEMRKVEPFSFGELYLPMYRYFISGAYSSYMEVSADTNLYKGYEGQNMKWNGKKFSEMKCFHFERMENIESEFGLFLKQLKEQGIEVVFVCAPIYSGLTAIVDNLPEFYETIQAYSEKYQIPVLDYTYDSLSYDTLYFYNATHLNKTGAKLFTTKLCQDLDSLLLFP